MVIPQQLKLPMSRTNFHSPKNVLTIEVWLYSDTLIPYHSGPKIETSPFYSLMICLKTVRWVANRIDLIKWWIPRHLIWVYTVCSVLSDDDDLGPVVQSVVSLTSSLRVISLTVLADSIYNILIFFAEKMWVAFALQKLLTFFQQKISAYLRITRCKF